MEDLHARHEDVAADASRAAAAYLSVGLAAAQHHVQRRAAAALRASHPPLPQLDVTGTPRSRTVGRAPGVSRPPAAELSGELARYADIARQALPELAPALLADPGWPDLAGELHRHAARGADPVRLLQDTAAARELDSARYPAQVLTSRLRPPTPTGSGRQASGADRTALPQPTHRRRGGAAAVAARSHPPLPTTSAPVPAATAPASGAHPAAPAAPVQARAHAVPVPGGVSRGRRR